MSAYPLGTPAGVVLALSAGFATSRSLSFVADWAERTSGKSKIVRYRHILFSISSSYLYVFPEVIYRTVVTGPIISLVKPIARPGSAFA
jgi:hypothetical protein